MKSTGWMKSLCDEVSQGEVVSGEHSSPLRVVVSFYHWVKDSALVTDRRGYNKPPSGREVAFVGRRTPKRKSYRTKDGGRMRVVRLRLVLIMKYSARTLFIIFHLFSFLCITARVLLPSRLRRATSLPEGGLCGPP